eukprot:2719387-Amphidinium_carterae.1
MFLPKHAAFAGSWATYTPAPSMPPSDALKPSVMMRSTALSEVPWNATCVLTNAETGPVKGMPDALRLATTSCCIKVASQSGGGDAIDCRAARSLTARVRVH